MPKESTSRTCRREMAADGGRWREMAGDGGEARVATGEDGEEAHERSRGHMVGRGKREGRGGAGANPKGGGRAGGRTARVVLGGVSGGLLRAEAMTTMVSTALTPMLT